MKAPVSKEIISSEVNQMMAEANGDFQEMIENLLIEAGHSLEFLKVKQAKRRKQAAEVKPKEESAETVTKEAPQKLIQRLSDERATVDNVDEEEESSHGDTTNLQE